jgi:hypothetical protein
MTYENKKSGKVAKEKIKIVYKTFKSNIKIAPYQEVKKNLDEAARKTRIILGMPFESDLRKYKKTN